MFCHFSLRFAILVKKGEQGKGERGRVGGVGQRQAGCGQVGQGQVRQGQAWQGRGGKSKKRVTSKDSLFHHYYHPNFYDFFPRAIAPFTGKIPTKYINID